MNRDTKQERLIEEYFPREGIVDERVIDAFRKIPRRSFVPHKYADKAYDNVPIPIGWGQTMTQPTLVALMTQTLHLTGTERVLEIGTGSGFQTAIMSMLCASVQSVERIEPLARHAMGALHEGGYWNAAISLGDGTRGLPSYAPYDGIIVTAGSPGIPIPLIAQLSTGGRLVIPIGPSQAEQILVVGIKGETELTVTPIEPTRFVPLIGTYGWKK